MSKSIFTQRVLADTLKSLLLEKPFCKISIQDLATKCGISRNAYYYYYKDKYELMHWIVDYELKETVKIYDPALPLTECLASIFHHFYKNKKFYYPCLEYTGQNSLYEYLSNTFFDLCYTKLKEECHRRNLLPNSLPLHTFSWMIASSMVEAIRTWHRDFSFNESYKSYIDPVNEYILQIFELFMNQHTQKEA